MVFHGPEEIPSPASLAPDFPRGLAHREGFAGHRHGAFPDEPCKLHSGSVHKPAAGEMGRRPGPRSIRNRQQDHLPVRDGGDGVQPGDATHSRIQLRSQAVFPCPGSICKDGHVGNHSNKCRLAGIRIPEPACSCGIHVRSRAAGDCREGHQADEHSIPHSGIPDGHHQSFPVPWDGEKIRIPVTFQAAYLPSPLHLHTAGHPSV